MTHSPPRLARWTIIFLFLLMAVGVPAVSVAAFGGTLAGIRWLVVFLVVVYEAGVVSLALLAFPDYERRYRQYAQRQFAAQNLPVMAQQGALAADLERLYVPANLDAKFINQSPHTLLKMLPGTLRQGDHSLWDFLASPSLAGQNFVVVGEPGSGKTTLLQHVAVCLAARKREVPAACKGFLPVLLFLREHAEAIRANPYLPLAHIISQHLARRQAAAPPAGWFEHQLEEGNCLILFDGLNEVADPELRRLVRAWVKGCLVAYPRNRFVITSRLREYRASPFTDVLTLEARAFSREQIGRLARRWRQARFPGARMATESDLLTALGKRPLMALAVNPLLLVMLTQLRPKRPTLPARRAEIYAALMALACSRKSRKMPAAHRQRLLQRLAYSMMCGGQLEIAPAEAANVMAPLLLALNIKDPADKVLRRLAGSTGVLVAVNGGAGRYGFAHLAFQEYLAAAHAAENQLQTDLVGRAGDIWWHETIRLYCAQTDASSVIASILSADQVSTAELVLALDCLDEVHQVRPAIWAYCQATLRDALDSVDDGDPERRKWVAEALLDSRLRRLAGYIGDGASNTTDRVGADSAWARDGSLISCAEYQLFLDEQRPEGQFFQPDHWAGYRYPAGHGLRPVTGVRAADAAAFCAWLTERQPGEWAYRLPTAHEVRDSARLAESAMGMGYWTASSVGERSGRQHVIFELAWVEAARPHATSEAAAMERVQADLSRDLLHLAADDLPRDLECNRLLSEALALSRELDHDLGLAQDPYHDLESAQALSHDLALALGFDLGLDMGFEFELARDRERNLGYDPSLEREPDPGLDAESLQRLAEARERVNGRLGPSGLWLRPRLSALDLTPAQTLTRALSTKLERLSDADGALAFQLKDVLEHNLSLALDRDLDRDLALALDSDRALANALALKLHRVYNLKRERALAYARQLSEMPEHEADREALSRVAQLIGIGDAAADDERALNDLVAARDLAIPLDLPLTAALELARVNAHNRDRASRLAQLLAAARDLARDQGRRRNRSLARLVFLLNALLVQPGVSPSEAAASEAAVLERQQLSSRYLELYQDFATLEGRVTGDLPAFEGICLVKVRAEKARQAEEAP